LTCTGRYEFAFSTSDGVKIQGRQVYPTVYPWQQVLGNTLNNMGVSYTQTAGTNSVSYCYFNNGGRVPGFWVLKSTIQYATSSLATNGYFYAGISTAIRAYGNADIRVKKSYTDLRFLNGLNRFSFYTLIDVPSALSAYNDNMFIAYGWNYLPASQTAISIISPVVRWANENERAVGTNLLGWSSDYQR